MQAPSFDAIALVNRALETYNRNAMTLKTDAIYENGVLRPLSPLALPDHARVTISVDVNDETRAEWLAESQRRLTAVWDNPDDDVFNDLLTS